MRVQLETGKSQVRPLPRSATFLRGDWSWSIFSVILSLLLIQEGQLSVSGERMCTILVRGLSLPVNVWFGKLTALNMTPLGWLGRKTSTQTIAECGWSGWRGGYLLSIAYRQFLLIVDAKLNSFNNDKIADRIWKYFFFFFPSRNQRRWEQRMTCLIWCGK